jgi:exopolyphosphatase/guanosine-5'-triphosphate,3'-diphosphate pyrophosphatase
MQACLFLALVSLIDPVSACAEACREIHAALDIGSGTVKAYAANVDVCEQRLAGSVYEEEAPFPCNEALEKSADGNLPPGFLEEAGPRLEALAKAARAKGATRLTARATSCLRKAANGAEVAAAIGKRIGVAVQVISQEEEAELGFLSAMAAHQVKPAEETKVVVWDIGSGSMQMEAASVGEDQEYKGGLAAVSFKNRVIEELLKKDPVKVSSPNPLGSASAGAVSLAEKHATRTVPAFFKKIKARRRWLGIGGTLAISVQDQVKQGAHSFTRGELEAALRTRAALKDEEIGGAYAATQVTNLALVLGYMKALGIEKVETARASLNQGALTQEAFHPARSSVPATNAPALPVKKPAVVPAPGKPPAPMGQ